MRKIIVSMFMSLDGVIQSPGAPKEDTSNNFKFGGWVAGHSDEEFGALVGDLYSQPYDLLLGKKTYDIFSHHWGSIAAHPEKYNFDEGEVGMAKAFTGVRKYVATHSKEKLPWANSESLGSDPVARIREIKKTDGPDLLMHGSSQFIQTLMENDLVDVYRLFIFPITLGTGKKLFDKGTIPGAFKVTKSTITKTGIIGMTYERNGEVKTGSFGSVD